MVVPGEGEPSPTPPKRKRLPKQPDTADSQPPATQLRTASARKAKTEPEIVGANVKERSQSEKNKIAIVVAIASACAAIGGSLITGLFEVTHIDPRLSNLHAVEMQSQTWGAGSWLSDWNLGPQKNHEVDPPSPPGYSIRIPFTSAFSFAPHVVVTVSEIDALNKSNLGWIVRPVNVTTKGFDISIVAIEETQIYEIGGQWVAFQQ
jgi:H-type lectin domain